MRRLLSGFFWRCFDTNIALPDLHYFFNPILNDQDLKVKTALASRQNQCPKVVWAELRHHLYRNAAESPLAPVQLPRKQPF